MLLGTRLYSRRLSLPNTSSNLKASQAFTISSWSYPAGLWKRSTGCLRIDISFLKYRFGCGCISWEWILLGCLQCNWRWFFCLVGHIQCHSAHGRATQRSADQSHPRRYCWVQAKSATRLYLSEPEIIHKRFNLLSYHRSYPALRFVYQGTIWPHDEHFLLVHLWKVSFMITYSL